MSISPAGPNTTPYVPGEIRGKAQDLREAVVDVAQKIADQVKENHPTVAANVGDRIQGRVDARRADRQERIENRIEQIKLSRDDQAAPSGTDPDSDGDALNVTA